MANTAWSVKDLLSKWGRELPQDQSRSLPWEVLKTLVDNLSADTQLPVDILLDVIQRRDISGLFRVASSLDVTKYTSSDLLLQDRLVVSLFAKFDFPDSPFDKREKAKLRFAEAEWMCREANHRVSQGLQLENDVNNVIHSAVRLVERILGEFKVSEMLTGSRFGPGSTLCVKGAYTTEYFKFSCKNPSVSTDAFPYAEALINSDHQWRALLLGVPVFDVVGDFQSITGLGVELSITDYNKVTFVPKNAETERSIGIEPYFNVFFQLGIGQMIRRRLKRHGIDLDSQLRNQLLARKGSLTGDLATIDFSMASDTLSLGTVNLMLPPEWFNHLDRLRSKYYVMDSKQSAYHKFSSMGNGYTFELETLIFYCLARASCEALGLDCDDISVYGDDVILPTGAVDLFNKSCAYLGFRINEEKSFSSGSFRESCGSDYLKGFNVRPVFCKELRTTQHVASLANRLLELDRSVGFGSRINDMLNLVVSLLHSRIPRDVRRLVVGPPSENVDGYIHSTDLSTLSGSELVRWNRRLFAWEYPIIRFTAKTLSRRDDALSLTVLKSLSRSDTLEPLRLEPRFISSLLVKLGERRVFDSFCKESVALKITGRKIGRLTLGTGLVWSLG